MQGNGDIAEPTFVLYPWPIKAMEKDDDLLSPRPGHAKSGFVECWQNSRHQAAAYPKDPMSRVDSG